MRAPIAGRAVALLGILAGLGMAQQFQFQLRISSSTSASIVANGATIGFSSAVGQSQPARLTATYVGSGKVTVPNSPQIFGSPDFTATLGGTPPVTLNPGDPLIVDILFRPSVATASNAQLSIPFTETISTTTPPTISANTISLNLQGTAPSFVLSYVLQADLNAIPLPPGGTLSFPDTLINTVSQANLNVTNIGSGSGQILDISMTGSAALKLVGKPLLPITITSAQQLTMALRYQPTAVGTDTGQIKITFDSGNPVTVNVQGNGVSPVFSYELVQGDQSTPVTPPGPITLPDTNVASTSNVIVRVRNTGNSDGTINSVPGVAGAAFQLSGLPVFPQVLKANDSFTFTLTFAPTQPGDLTGQLLIGNDLFSLAGRGLGPKLVFSYTSGGTMTTLGPTDAVVFSPTAIGQTLSLDFTVTNSGTTAAKISNIGIGEPKSPFSLAGVPGLPASLDPSASLQFTLNFTPTTTGFTNGTMRVDTNTIPLIGSGTAPPPLPAYTFQGPSGNVDPLSQPAVRLKLSSPYPIALSGVLTLANASDLVPDPAVQFATGGRVVPFVIPANGTDANFAGQGPQIRLQTGSVASTFTLTPSFATQDGGVDVTPASPATLQFSVAPVAPVLIALQAVNETANSFALNVTGYSTTRTLTSLTVQFTAAASMTLGTTTGTIDLRQASTVWFQSTASQTFGGQFTVTVPFTLSGTPPTGVTLLQTIASVSATISNERGTSNSLQVTLP